MSLEHAPSKAERTGGKVYLTSRQVRERYGNCSDMTIWRWQNDPALNFPQPMKINHRRLWTQESLERFDAERTAESAA